MSECAAASGAAAWPPGQRGKVRAIGMSSMPASGMVEAQWAPERRIDTVERILPVADEAGLELTQRVVACVIARPGVASAIAGPRTVDQLEDLVAGSEVSLTDGIQDRIDAVVAPGTDVGALDMAYRAPGIPNPAVQRRTLGCRSAG